MTLLRNNARDACLFSVQSSAAEKLIASISIQYYQKKISDHLGIGILE